MCAYMRQPSFVFLKENMKAKTIEKILPPPAPHMVGDGFRVHNFFPSGLNMANNRMSPFL